MPMRSCSCRHLQLCRQRVMELETWGFGPPNPRGPWGRIPKSTRNVGIIWSIMQSMSHTHTVINLWLISNWLVLLLRYHDCYVIIHTTKHTRSILTIWTWKVRFVALPNSLASALAQLLACLKTDRGTCTYDQLRVGPTIREFYDVLKGCHLVLNK